MGWGVRFLEEDGVDASFGVEQTARAGGRTLAQDHWNTEGWFFVDPVSSKVGLELRELTLL